MQWNLKALFFVSIIMAAFSAGSSLLLLYFALTSHENNSVFDAFQLPYIEYGKIVMLMYLKVCPEGVHDLLRRCMPVRARPPLSRRLARYNILHPIW